jgi:hypothetical protein
MWLGLWKWLADMTDGPLGLKRTIVAVYVMFYII